MAEDFSRGGEGEGPREEYRDPWSANSVGCCRSGISISKPLINFL